MAARGGRALIAALIAAVVLTGDGRAMVYRYTHLQFNLCGNACSSGGPGVVDYVADAIRLRRPFAVTLNELCRNQYDRLRARLVGYRGRFDAAARCHDGTPYGCEGFP